MQQIFGGIKQNDQRGYQQSQPGWSNSNINGNDLGNINNLLYNPNLVLKNLQNEMILSNINAHIAKDILKQMNDVATQKYRFPAIIKIAKVHKNATKFGFNDNNTQKLICPCCYQNVNTKPVELCYETTNIDQPNNDQKQRQSTQQTFKLTSGIALFFSFIKMLIIYLLMRAITTDFFNIISSRFIGYQCTSVVGQCSYMTQTSSYNMFKSNNPSYVYALDILNLITVIISIPFFICYRKIQYKLYDDIDQNIQTQDDYGLFIQNIPIIDFPKISKSSKEKVIFRTKQTLEHQLIQALQQFKNNWKNYENFQSGSVENDFYQTISNRVDKSPGDRIIRSIVFCYDISELQKLKQFRTKLMDQYQRDIQKNIKDGKTEVPVEDPEDIYQFKPKQIQYLNQAQIVLSKSFAEDISALFAMTHFIGCAFVTFEYQHYRQHLIESFSQQSPQGAKLRLTKPSGPDDVFWKNLKIPHSLRTQRLIISYLILFMTLTFAFGFVLLFDFIKSMGQPQQAKQLSVSQKVRNMVITTGVTVIILVINYLLNLVITNLTEWEKHQTRSNYLVSRIVKLVISQFVNNAMLYFIISRIRSSSPSSDEHFLSPTGLVVQISSLIIFSGVIQIITNLLFFGSIMRRLKLWWKYRNLKNEDTVNMFQVRLNKQFQYIQFDIAARYAYYLLQVLTVSFYSYLVPIGVPALIAILCVQYWVDKYNLFRRSSLKYQMNFSLSRRVLKIFETSLFVYAAGSFVFSLYIHRTIDSTGNYTYHISYINLVALIIATIYICLLIFLSESRERRLLSSYETLEKFSYTECLQAGKFTYTFWKQNPATSLLEEKDVTKYENVNIVKNTVFKYNDQEVQKHASNKYITSLIEAPNDESEIYDQEDKYGQ